MPNICLAGGNIDTYRQQILDLNSSYGKNNLFHAIKMHLKNDF